MKKTFLTLIHVLVLIVLLGGPFLYVGWGLYYLYQVWQELSLLNWIFVFIGTGNIGYLLEILIFKAWLPERWGGLGLLRAEGIRWSEVKKNFV